jgi:hypothetical protein
MRSNLAVRPTAAGELGDSFTGRFLAALFAYERGRALGGAAQLPHLADHFGKDIDPSSTPTTSGATTRGLPAGRD